MLTLARYTPRLLAVFTILQGELEQYLDWG